MELGGTPQNRRTIAVVGLGYVGLPLAVEFGKTRPVVGFDIDVDRIASLREGYDRTFEVSREELNAAENLTLSADIESISKAEIYIITVPTPVDKAKRPDFGPLIEATTTVGRILKPWDIVIYESTVYPGATEEICVPILENESGLRFINEELDSSLDCWGGFYCGYSPERVNPGDKTRRLTQIIKITSGSTREVSEAIDNLYKQIITAGTHMASSIKVAEASKVIENSQRDLNIAFVNELSLIFNRLNIDTHEVLEAAGTKWNFLPFSPGLVGGHCIGVDPYYLTHKSQEIGYQPQVILSGRRINDSMSQYAADSVIKLMIRCGIDVSTARVGLLGITFKENCPDVRNSKSIDLFYALKNWGVDVTIIDPWADQSELLEAHGLKIDKIDPAVKFDSLIISVPHNQFRDMQPRTVRDLCVPNGRPVLADLKALHDRKTMETLGFEVFRF